jgi:hypothetical protein
VRKEVNSSGVYMKPFSSNIRKKVPESCSGGKSLPKTGVPTANYHGLIRDCREAVLLVEALCEGQAKSVEASILSHIPIQRERVLELLAD